jgi:hypothetical protein
LLAGHFIPYVNCIRWAVNPTCRFACMIAEIRAARDARRTMGCPALADRARSR